MRGFLLEWIWQLIHHGIISITLNGGIDCVFTSFRNSHSASFTSGEIRWYLPPLLITSNLTRAMKPSSTTRTIFSRYASAATTRLSNAWRRAERLPSSTMKAGLSGNRSMQCKTWRLNTEMAGWWNWALMVWAFFLHPPSPSVIQQTRRCQRSSWQCLSVSVSTQAPSHPRENLRIIEKW